MGTTIESDWENTRLLEELEAARAEIENVQLVSQLHYDANLSLRQQLAASQAEKLGLRNALEKLLDVFERCEAGFSPRVEVRFAVLDLAKAPLSTPSGDQSALREVIARVLDGMSAHETAKALRSGEWTPEALK